MGLKPRRTVWNLLQCDFNTDKLQECLMQQMELLRPFNASVIVHHVSNQHGITRRKIIIRLNLEVQESLKF
jgi:hypothetical protein